MIEESLLFRMGYLFPDITAMDVVISFFIAVALIVFFFRKHLPRPVKRPPLPPLPKKDDAHFEEKLSSSLRAYLSLKYSPEHTRAHTIAEIKNYAKDDPLLEVLSELEGVEYRSKKLSEGEREVMLERVKVLKRK